VRRGKKDFLKVFKERVGDGLRKSVPLRCYSSFRIGGDADYFFEAKSISELVKSISLAREFLIPFYIIGGGYNILFDDEGFRGLIIKNSSRGIYLKEKEVEALSGTLLREILEFSSERSLGGFEFLAGIPGTVGGAVFSNSGAFGESVGDILNRALLLKVNGEEIEVGNDYFRFGYRTSFIQKSKDILLRASFLFQKTRKEEIQAKIQENLRKRREKLPPPQVASAGSYFKNPVLPDGRRVAAGYLLEKVNAKELQIGEAAVDSSHANFIINKGNASAKEVKKLAEELKKRVREKFNVELEEEVIYLPANPLGA